MSGWGPRANTIAVSKGPSSELAAPILGNVVWFGGEAGVSKACLQQQGREEKKQFQVGGQMKPEHAAKAGTPWKAMSKGAEG